MQPHQPYLVFFDDDPDELRDLGTILAGEYDYLPVRWPVKEPVELARMPDIIVLDLYFPSDAAPSIIPPTKRQEQREEAVKIAKEFEQLYDGNRNGRDLLRHTFDCISKGYDLLWQQCEALGQSPKVGRELLARIRANSELDGVPVVFYSRKATVEEAAIALQAGAFAVIPKPSMPPKRKDRQYVLDQLELARTRFKQLAPSTRKGMLGPWNITINATMFKQELQEVAAQKVEFIFAKLGA